MKPEIIDLWGKQLEQRIISISAKVADAVEKVQEAKEKIASSEDMLIKTQLELEELFLQFKGKGY